MKRERINPAMVCAVLNEIGKAKAAGRIASDYRCECVRVLARYLRLTSFSL